MPQDECRKMSAASGAGWRRRELRDRRGQPREILALELAERHVFGARGVEDRADQIAADLQKLRVSGGAAGARQESRHARLLGEEEVPPFGADLQETAADPGAFEPVDQV